MVDTKSCRCCPRKSKSRVPLRTLIPEGSAVIGASGGTLHGPEVPEGDHQQKKLPHGAQALDLTSVPSALHEPARKEAWMFWLLQEYMRGACQNPRNFCRRKKRRPKGAGGGGGGGSAGGGAGGANSPVPPQGYDQQAYGAAYGGGELA